MCGSWMETCTTKACSSLPFQLSQWRTAWLCLLWICLDPGSSWTHCRSGPACCETMWTSSKLNLMSWEKWSRRVSPALFVVLTWVCKVLRVLKKKWRLGMKMLILKDSSVHRCIFAWMILGHHQMILSCVLWLEGASADQWLWWTVVLFSD